MSMLEQYKRKNCLSWDETFMQMSILIAKRSKDPNTQNGACIVDDNNIIVGLGYNGFPRGCSDDYLPWGRDGDFLEKKYAYVVHAETNAIYNANKSVRGCKLYCTLFPCNECAKAIIQTGITEINYNCDKYHEEKEFIASRKLLDLAGVHYRSYQTTHQMEFRPVGLNKNYQKQTNNSLAANTTIYPLPTQPKETDTMVFTDIFNN